MDGSLTNPASPMFEVFDKFRRMVMHSPVEGGGYPEDVLSGMVKAGYTFRWMGKRWRTGQVSEEIYEQGVLW